MKNSFVLYTDYKKHIAKLNDSQKGVLMMAIMQYQAGEELPEMDAVTDMCFGFIADQIDRDNEAYERKIEAKREAGQKGGEARASKSKQKVAKASTAKNAIAEVSKDKQNVANVADNDNVNDNVLKEKEAYASSKKDFPEASAKSDHESNCVELYAPVEAIPVLGGKEWRCTMAEYNEFKRLYPAVDIDQAFRQMRGWCLSNPKNNKTMSGVKRFVTSWLARDQNSARVQKKPYRDPKLGERSDTDYDNEVFNNMLQSMI